MPSRDDGTGWSRHTPPYMFTNEALRTLVDHVALEGKDILAVGAAGDFTTQAIAEGARSVTPVDISLHSARFAELKHAAVQALDYKEFLGFYTGNDRTPIQGIRRARTKSLLPWRRPNVERYQKEHYARIRPLLEQDTQAYFDSLINHPERLAAHIKVTDEWNVVGEHIPYLTTQENYTQAQQAMRKNPPATPLISGLFAAFTPGRYDLVYASNAFQNDFSALLHFAENGSTVLHFGSHERRQPLSPARPISDPVMHRHKEAGRLSLDLLYILPAADPEPVIKDGLLVANAS